VKNFREIIFDRGSIDIERYDRAYAIKKLNKIRNTFKDHPDYNSDISTIDSAYDSDDESETTFSRADLSKDFGKYNKKIATQLSEAKIDISRKGLKLKTKEDSIKNKEEEKQKREAEEEFDKQQEERERSEKIGDLRDGIKSIKEQIKRFTKRHNDFLDIMKNDNSGITQEIFDSEYSQTSIINTLNKRLEEAQNQLSRLLR